MQQIQQTQQAQRQQYTAAQGRRTEEGGESCREMVSGIGTPTQVYLNVMETIDQINHKFYKKGV